MRISRTMKVLETMNKPTFRVTCIFVISFKTASVAGRTERGRGVLSRNNIYHLFMTGLILIAA